MRLDVPADLRNALTDALQHTDVVALVEIDIPDGAARFALWDQDVSWGGETFKAEPTSFSEIPQRLDGSRAGFGITLGNVKDADGVEAPWSERYNAQELNGAEISIRVVKLSLAPSELLVRRWYADGAGFAETARLRVGSVLDTIVTETPRHPIAARTCTHRFKQGGCQSQANHTDCPGKNLHDCAERHPNGILSFSQYPFFAKNARRGVGV